MTTTLVHDLRQAWRAIVRTPVVATVVITSLGIGIGVNTTVFSWIQAMILSPLPGVVDAGSFDFVEPRTENGGHPGSSWLEYVDLRAQVPSLPDQLAFRMAPFTVGAADHVERTYGLLVSANYFSVLGLRPAAGRFPLTEEVATAGSAPVVVISHEFWQTRYNGAPNAIGQTLRVNERPLTIIGVTPRGFQGTVLGLDFDLWVPATMAPELFVGSRELEDRTARGYTVMARLAPPATIARAQQETEAAMQQLAQLHPESNAALHADVLPFWRAPRGPQMMLANALLLLQGVMLLVLLAVCGNTANLMLARASARQREIGVRLALGAGPWRVMSLLLTESLTLALVGAGVGAALAVWGTQALRAVPMISAFPIKFQTGVDLVTLAFAIGLGIACGFIFGMVPALQLARVDPQHAMRAGTQGAGRSRTRNALMSMQVALALIVLTAAALFLRNFRETRQSDTGFRRDGILLGAYDLSIRNPTADQSRAFAATVIARLAALPHVEGAAIATSVPLDIHGFPLRSFTLEGRARTDAASDQASNNVVTPGYFTTMGIPLREGHDFASLSDVTAPPQVIVNDAFVQKYLAGSQAIGRRIESRGKTYVIIGVARTSLYDSFGERPMPAMYFSYRDRPMATGEIHVYASRGVEQFASEMRRVVRELDPGLVVYDVRTLNDHIEKNLFLRRIPARMFAVLGPLLLLLAAIGIYAVVSYSISRRTVEIGVRHALGASTSRIVREIVAETLRTVAWGAAIGWIVSLLVDVHVARGVIYLPIVVGVPAILFMVATIACWIPARRAAGADPMIALRSE
ncbi:MAG TPA: ABC transporter permease [Gemmatimonadaceae bacterium]|nr:ABC transporter permease [Gemmatimonadaceae bacterium]